MTNQDFINSLTKKSDLPPGHKRAPEPHHSDRIPILDQGIRPLPRPNPATPANIQLWLPEIEWLIRKSKIPSFFSFIPDSQRKSLVREHYIYKDFMIFALDLLPEELETIRTENDLWQKVLEAFLFLFNHMSVSFFPNITFGPVIINGEKKINFCVILFKGKTASGKIWEGYRKLASFCLNINNNQGKKDESENKPTEPIYKTDDERIYQAIQKMLEEKNISVRKIFGLDMRQWRSKIIYKKIMDLEIFKIDRENQNEKIYQPENFGRLTQEVITEILTMENPQN